MIITNLMGGLGNQLFQHAAGYAAAMRLQTELRVAVDMYEGYRLHQGYELSKVFDLSLKEASSEDLRQCLGPWRSRAARRAIGRLWRGSHRDGRAIFQPGEAWSKLPDLPPTAYLQGYWQDERFFVDAADSIRSTLRFRYPPSPENARWLDRIDDGVSVGVHMRRGDYVSNTKNRSLYAECSPEYYSKAAELALATHPNAQFFVFSDDPDWAHRLATTWGANVDTVSHNRGAESYNDLRLMSRCHHIIIANSSFSWWAAWLNEYQGKLVIAPSRWMVSINRGHNIIPSRWIRM